MFEQAKEGWHRAKEEAELRERAHADGLRDQGLEETPFGDRLLWWAGRRIAMTLAAAAFIQVVLLLTGIGMSVGTLIASVFVGALISGNARPWWRRQDTWDREQEQFGYPRWEDTEYRPATGHTTSMVGDLFREYNKVFLVIAWICVILVAVF